jgi:hypothetical protein
MDRRTFISSVTLAVLAVPLAAEAQPAGKVYRIGRLSLSAFDARPGHETSDAVVEGLRELGYVEGRDFLLERRDANGIADRLPKLAEELVRIPVDVLLVTGRHGHGCCSPSNWDYPYRLHDGGPGGPRGRPELGASRSEHYWGDPQLRRLRSWRQVHPVAEGSLAAPVARWVSEIHQQPGYRARRLLSCYKPIGNATRDC